MDCGDGLGISTVGNGRLLGLSIENAMCGRDEVENAKCHREDRDLSARLYVRPSTINVRTCSRSKRH